MATKPYCWITESNGMYYIDFTYQPGGYAYRYMGDNGGYATEADAQQALNSWVWADQRWLMSNSKRI